MRKVKIIVASLMVLCVLCFAGVIFYLLVISDSAEPTNEEREVAILRVAGLVNGDKNDHQALRQLYQSRVIARQLNLDSGTLLAPGAETGPRQCEPLPAGQDPAQIRQRCAVVDIWLIQNNQHQIQQVILPIYGKGAKSMLRAVIAMDTDGRTVRNMLYYAQNETPFLGAKVEDPAWLSQWPGKKVLDDNGQPALKVVQDAGGQHDAYTVDGISGATLTSTGVERSVNYWMGERGYGRFLQRLQKDKQLLDNLPQ